MPRPLPCVLRTLLRHSSSSHLPVQPRLDLFAAELQRQQRVAYDHLSRLVVFYKGLPSACTLSMNKGISTPNDCAMHIQEALSRRSVVALVNGQPWAMRRPLEGTEEGGTECHLVLHHMKHTDPTLANETFWRSCSVLLGAVLQSAFKADFDLQLCSFPPPVPRSGSFVYDVRLTRRGRPSDWVPSPAELRLLSCIAQRLALQEVPFQPLQVDVGLAQQLFAGSELKTKQIEAMAAAWKGPGNPRLTVYRVGNFLELCRGALMNHTGQVGRFAVTAAYPIDTPDYGPLLRFQGVALPPDFLTHYSTFDVLLRRAAQPNPAPLPALKMPAADPRALADV